jgi:UDP-N-acetylmuramate dehydrogenase
MFEKNVSLKELNTFGIDVKADEYIKITDPIQLKEVLNHRNDVFILSGGSNILLTRNIEQTVVHLDHKGIEVLDKSGSDNTALIKAQGGENWHDFVRWTLSQNYGGLENLSLIPGNVGTSPMQNIGAYGVEIKDVFHSLRAIDRSTGNFKTFTKEECQFGYRESVFKNKYKGRYIITDVTFELSKKNHSIKASYGAIGEQLKTMGVDNPTIHDISKAVIEIRQSKLPDPAKLGNSGSFFKNPVIDIAKFSSLLSEYKDIPSYPVSDTLVKVPAGWLVEKCGYKGKRVGDAGVHKKQALVLVNYNQASGIEILNLARDIQKTVNTQFGIELEMEVNII